MRKKHACRLFADAVLIVHNIYIVESPLIRLLGVRKQTERANKGLCSVIVIPLPSSI